MNINSINNKYFEKSYVRVVAQFSSKETLTTLTSILEKYLNISIVRTDPSSQFEGKLIRKNNFYNNFEFSSYFLIHRDSRLLLINLFKFITENVKTKEFANLFLDLKVYDKKQTNLGIFKGSLFYQETKIENIDKMKFILNWKEDSLYNLFKERKFKYLANSVKLLLKPLTNLINTDITNINKNFYSVKDSSLSGINFETISDGYLRLQYLGGNDYSLKIDETLTVLNLFVLTTWKSIVEKQYTDKDIDLLNELYNNTKRFKTYSDFKKLFKNIDLTIDLVSDEKVIDSYFNNISDKLFDITSNIKGMSKDFKINYDTYRCMFQIKDAEIIINNIKNIDFIACKLLDGYYTLCTFHHCKVNEGYLKECYVLNETTLNTCIVEDTTIKKTGELNNCNVIGKRGTMDGEMIGGILDNSPIGGNGELNDTKIL